MECTSLYRLQILCEKQGCVFDDFDRIDKGAEPATCWWWLPLFITALFLPLKAVLDRTQRYFEARFSLGIRPPIKNTGSC